MYGDCNREESEWGDQTENRQKQVERVKGRMTERQRQP